MAVRSATRITTEFGPHDRCLTLAGPESVLETFRATQRGERVVVLFGWEGDARKLLPHPDGDEVRYLLDAATNSLTDDVRQELRRWEPIRPRESRLLTTIRYPVIDFRALGWSYRCRRYFDEMEDTLKQAAQLVLSVPGMAPMPLWVAAELAFVNHPHMFVRG